MVKQNTQSSATGGPLLTERDAATYLRQRPRTLRLWRQTRGLPHLKITGKVVLYRQADLDSWLDQHRLAIVG